MKRRSTTARRFCLMIRRTQFNSSLRGIHFTTLPGYRHNIEYYFLMQPTAITSSTCVPSRSSRNERKQWKISGFLNREGEGFDPFTCMSNDQPLPMCEEGGHYILTRQTPPDEVGLAVDLDTSPPIHLANPRDLAFGH